jgi:hypothetical protein
MKPIIASSLWQQAMHQIRQMVIFAKIHISLCVRIKTLYNSSLNYYLTKNHDAIHNIRLQHDEGYTKQ